MKKSLLALAVVAVAASANAATVYDKDGTSLTLDGRVQAVFYSGNHNKVAENDSSIQNSARFGIGGKTQITDWVSGFGYAQWNTSNGADKDRFEARDQFVGADFGEYGLLKAGRFLDSSYYAEEVTDHYEDAAGTAQGRLNSERRNGQLVYIYDNYGFHAQAGLQTAVDNAAVIGDFNNFDSYAVNSGFNGALGYTFDNVVFGPLSIRAGYSYLKGQTDNDLLASNGDGFDKFKHAAAGISWGNLDSGFYVAALYDYAKMTYQDHEASENDKLKGYEFLVGYAFDNGVSARIGYESAKLINKVDDDKSSFKIKRIPVFVNYQINSNFNVWGEVGFNAGSDHYDYDEKVDKKIDHQIFSVGARYTF